VLGLFIEKGRLQITAGSVGGDSEEEKDTDRH